MSSGNRRNLSNGKSPGVALSLAWFPLTGFFGIDKFYVGHPWIGVIQIMLTLSVIGMLVNIPWNMINQISLIIFILMGTAVPFLYPLVKWNPITKIDKIIAGIVIGLFILNLVIISVSSSNTKSKKELKDKE